MKENKQSAALATILKVITVLTQPLLRFPKDCKIEGREYSDCILVSVRSKGVDYGQLVGKGGETVKALQEILATIGERSRQTVKLSVAVPALSDRNELPIFKPSEKWSMEPVRAIAEVIGNALLGECGVTVEDFNDNTIVTFASKDDEREWDWPGDELNHVFHAIGKAMGRNEIIVQLNQEETM
jgi:predicted RNA-binding protein YlqC (UPF0109 family)